jgi:hypothetical protein
LIDGDGRPLGEASPKVDCLPGVGIGHPLVEHQHAQEVAEVGHLLYQCIGEEIIYGRRAGSPGKQEPKCQPACTGVRCVPNWRHSAGFSATNSLETEMMAVSGAAIWRYRRKHEAISSLIRMRRCCGLFRNFTT